MLSRDEILKPIWYAFTALDVDRNGKVSKSQLKVLSHNLCTILKIPHNTSALEEHFKDDDEGPVSTQGYMPYLNMFILDKIQANFDFNELNKMCWTLSAPKHISSKHLLISEADTFKVWCIFNFLSEDKYPLHIVTEELEYFLRRLFAAMGCSWNEDRFEGYKMQLGAKKKHLNAWELIELIGMGHFTKGINPQTLSMGINEVYQELVMDVVKQGYMMKKGHKRKNWTERWFELHLNYMSYYVSEDLIEQKGCISLDRNCCVESLPDKDGKKNLFIIKCVEKSFEINASDKKAKQEWIQAIQDCIVHIRQGLSSPHRESRQKRRELRNRMKAEQEMMENRMRQLQLANESKQAQLEAMTKNLQEASMRGDLEEQRRVLTQKELLDQYRRDLEQEKMARMQMEEQVVEKANEVEQYWQRMQELEDMYRQLKKALDDERQAKEDEEALRKLQARLLQEEANKRLELEQIHHQQQEILSQSQKEKEELERERAEKESALQAAQEQLQSLRRQREGAQEEYMVVTKKLERAANKTKNWKHKVSKHEGLLQIIQPGNKSPTKMTNWGQAAFTETELNEMERIWQENKTRSYDGQ
ncbi:switch-associated protein 70 isoform X1 [Sinocyclocheilus anshuiensis]|uniref:switch-associated protein 70 isoform X1 n=1 Tax=Sinocyclocheilus anshuiensis TaxID=1608454 RepID=UPI0007B83A6A|nr:PREDICTED: switch-associated protein 70-like isoform X1 [Sinocyclocheilus anshuiensis]